MPGDRPIRTEVTPAAALENLALLDEIRPAELDPATWSRNLAALRGTQPQLAEHVQRAAPPASWRAALSLDDVASWRVERQGEPPEWLDGAALPATRAASMDLRKAADRNIALATIGTGHEPASLVERTAPTQAVFVFEDDLSQVAAVLRTVRLDAAIEQGRLWILTDSASAEPLLALLRERPGLMPPGIILHLPGVSAERIGRLQETLRIAAEKIAAIRAPLLAAARSRFASGASSPRNAGRPFALVDATVDRGVHAACGALADAVSAAGSAAEALILDRPDRVHALWSAERLAALCPGHVIFCEAPAENVVLPDDVEVCVWHLSSPDSSAQPPRVARHFAATPRIEKRLRERSGAGAKVVPLYWGAWTEAEDSSGDTERLPDGAIVVLGELPDDSAEACGIDQPAHKLLWQALHGTVAARWESRDILFPEGLLTAVEREAGVSLRDRTTRAHMLRQIEARLAPAGVLRKVVEFASACSMPVATIGLGWRTWTDSDLIIAPTVPAGRLPRGWQPLAAVLTICGDPFAAAIQAAARGWPLLVHAPGGVSPDDAFGGVLASGRDYSTFRTGRELRSALEAIRASALPSAERARNTAARINAEHGWADRGRALLRALGE